MDRVGRKGLQEVAPRGEQVLAGWRRWEEHPGRQQKSQRELSGF